MNADKNEAEEVTRSPDVTCTSSTPTSTHPLLIPHVLCSVLGYLPTDIVKETRVVCQDWNYEACLLLQKRQPEAEAATFLFDKDINSYLRVFGESPAATSPQLHSTYQLYNSVQFTELTDSWGNQPPQPTPLHRFLLAHGSHIRTLILQQKKPPILERELYWALENVLPVLESLTLRYVPLQPSTEPPSSALLHKNYKFPTIKHLTIGTGSFQDGHRERWVRPIRYIPTALDLALDLACLRGWPMYDHLLPETGTLNWLGDEGSNHAVLVNLFGSVPNLESVSISTLDMSGGLELAFSPDHHPPWLEPCYKELRFTARSILKVFYSVPSERLSRNLSTLNFPLHVNSEKTVAVLERLFLGQRGLIDHHKRQHQLTHQCFRPGTRSATLDIQLETSERKVVQRVAHLIRTRANCSNTQRVSLSASNPGIWTEFQLQLNKVNRNWFPCVLPCLHVLKICGKPRPGQLQHLVDPETLRNMALSFPQLGVLQIPGANDNTLRAVYAGFPNLTGFAATCGQFTDAGVTGLSHDDCRALNEGSQESAAQLRCSLYIGNLTKLRHLHLHSDSMTPCSVAWGIARCEVLEVLELRSVQVDDETVRVIVREKGDGGSGASLRFLLRLDVRECPAITTGVTRFLSTSPCLMYIASGVSIRGELGRGWQCSLDWENETYDERCRRKQRHQGHDGWSARGDRTRYYF